MENEYLDLPDDPEEAFAMLHRKKFAELETYWENNESGHWYEERRYVDIMIAFDEVMSLGCLTGFKNVPNVDQKFAEFWHSFRRHVEITSQKYLIEAARRQKKGSETIIVLEEAAKSAIQHLVQRIREHLNQLDLPEAKRDALFNKLNAFAAEIDRNRTRAEAFFAFAIDLAKTARTMNDELKPLQQTVDKVFEWIEKAKKYTEVLPPWEERKKIERPKEQLPKLDRHTPDIDDEIPF